MVDYKKLFLYLCEKLAQDNKNYFALKEDMFKEMQDSDATPEELVEYVRIITGNK